MHFINLNNIKTNMQKPFFFLFHITFNIVLLKNQKLIETETILTINYYLLFIISGWLVLH